MREERQASAMKSYGVRGTESGQPDWSRAIALDDFCSPWEARPVPATEFRALVDEQSLYFRFDCHDDDLVLAAGDTAAQRVLGSDRVELFMTRDLGLDPYYCLEIEPRGAVLAYRARYHRRFDWDFGCRGLAVRARIDGARYCVEARLPLATLRELELLAPGAREFFAGVYRADFSHRPDGSVRFDWLPWIDPRTDKPDFHVPAAFGRFELV